MGACHTAALLTCTDEEIESDALRPVGLWGWGLRDNVLTDSLLCLDWRLQLCQDTLPKSKGSHYTSQTSPAALSGCITAEQ